MRRFNWISVVSVLVLTTPVPSPAENGLEILTWPSGLVAGPIKVDVFLGSSGGPAELFVDGNHACTLTAASTECAVDLGPELHVHLLQLVRQGTQGNASERVERWLNRPGYEADLAVQLATRPIGTTCGGRLHWSHTTEGQPVSLEVEAEDQSWSVAADSPIFGYPCPAADRTEVLAASAVFADGRRAETSVLVGSTGRSAGPGPEPVLLQRSQGDGGTCSALDTQIARDVVEGERGGFEVAFVLDPRVDYGSLAGLGLRAGSGSGSPSNSQAAWDRATAAFSDADHLWYVVPDSSLRRVDGFAGGSDTWLGELFKRGPETTDGQPQLAEAVATAGLTVAGAPRRRAVVLILGPGAANDPHRFSVEQVLGYLNEIGAPLHVVRTVSRSGDAWPDGTSVDGLSELAGVFEAVRRKLDEQCVAWYAGETRADTVASSLPTGVVRVGGEPGPSNPPLVVWRRREFNESTQTNLPASGEPFTGEQVEVTAIGVLVRATEKDGRPVTNLNPQDLAVTEDGLEVPVLELDPLHSAVSEVDDGTSRKQPSPDSGNATIEIPVSIYIERQISGVADVVPALNALAQRSEWLTSLGPVSVVVAERKVETLLEGTRDPKQLREVLEQQAATPQGQHAVERIRTDYVRQIRVYPDRGGGESDADEPANVVGGVKPGGINNIQRVSVMTAARSAVFEENDLLRRTSERLTDWALSKATSGPKLLMAVGLGFDEDPGEFYLPFIERQMSAQMAASVRPEFIRYQQGPRTEAVGRELAAAGWLVVPVATRTTGKQLASADTGGGDRFQAFLTDNPEGAAFNDSVDFLMLDPLGSQKHIARPSGGDVVMGANGLDKLIAESSGWYRLTYQVARAPDGAYHDVTIACKRPDVEVRGTGVVVSGTSEGRAGMRLRSLFADSENRGELPVTLTLEKSQTGEGNASTAKLTVMVNVDPIAPLFKEGGTRALRVSVGVLSGDVESEIVHQLTTVTGEVSTFRYDVPLQWKKMVPSEVGVVVEDLGSGAWGGNVVKFGR